MTLFRLVYALCPSHFVERRALLFSAFPRLCARLVAVLAEASLLRGIGRGLGLLLACLVFCSCATMQSAVVEAPPTPEEISATAKANNLLAEMGQRHRVPQTFKGTGTLTIRDQEHLRFNQPAVWIGVPAEKLRVVIRGMGLPLVSMASDGRFVYLILHDRGEFHRKAIDEGVLKDVLAVSVPLSDIIHLLAGQVPVRDYRLARIDPATDGAQAVVLMQASRKIVEKIHLDTSQQVQAVELFDTRGALTYRADFISRHDLNGYGLPAELMITDAHGTTLVLKVERVWADFPVSDSLFVLAPPA